MPQWACLKSEPLIIVSMRLANVSSARASGGSRRNATTSTRSMESPLSRWRLCAKPPAARNHVNQSRRSFAVQICPRQRQLARRLAGLRHQSLMQVVQSGAEPTLGPGEVDAVDAVSHLVGDAHHLVVL